uniref:Uncharacterized protein n=1 Tax=Parascaris univalens TaxID=6257 RepID=A0A914ZYX9_PARUN
MSHASWKFPSLRRVDSAHCSTKFYLAAMLPIEGGGATRKEAAAKLCRTRHTRIKFIPRILENSLFEYISDICLRSWVAGNECMH